MGKEPLPPPIRSRISPPLPVAAPLNGSTVVGKLWVSAFSEMTVLTSSSLKKLGLAAAAGWKSLSLGPSMKAQLSLYAETMRPGLTAEVFFISLKRGDDAAGIDRRGLLYQLEEGAFHLHSVDDEGAVEYLVAAVFRIDLGESEYLAVGQRSAEPSLAERSLRYWISSSERARPSSLLYASKSVMWRMGSG